MHARRFFSVAASESELAQVSWQVHFLNKLDLGTNFSLLA